MNGRALIVQANAMPQPGGHGGLPLPDASVHLCVTSPPYWRKRKYAISGPGEIGNEPNWQLYLENLWVVTGELLPVLHPSGSIWVNLGDTRVTGTGPEWLGIPVKSRLLLPERYRIGCQDRYAAQGVIVRQVQIHDKSNGLPESVDDRTRDSHEDWVQIVKRPTYYAAMDTLREPHTGHAGNDARPALNSHSGTNHRSLARDESQFNPLGKLPGSVWRIPSDPLKLPAHLGIEHYAAFSPEWPRRLVLAFSPPGVCVECGEGRRPVVDRAPANGKAWAATQQDSGRGWHGGDPAKRTLGTAAVDRSATILGWACSCTPFTDHPERAQGRGFVPNPSDKTAGGSANGAERNKAYRESLRNPPAPVREYHLDGWTPPPTRPAVVLDPFSGVGTTCLVARALGRIGIGVDLSHSYSRAARWRVFESGEWQQVIERTTGRKARPLPKHDPAQERLAL